MSRFGARERIVEKIATHLKCGESVSTMLVKAICDAERGVEQKKKAEQTIALSHSKARKMAGTKNCALTGVLSNCTAIKTAPKCVAGRRF